MIRVISQRIDPFLISGEDASDKYFSIGHGDFNEDFGGSPKYYVWAFLDGKIKTGTLGREDKDGGTHGSLWGHDRMGKTYKGRYEPETGVVSVVNPDHRIGRSVPQFLIDALYNRFHYITNIFVF